MESYSTFGGAALPPLAHGKRRFAKRKAHGSSGVRSAMLSFGGDYRPTDLIAGMREKGPPTTLASSRLPSRKGVDPRQGVTACRHSFARRGEPTREHHIVPMVSRRRKAPVSVRRPTPLNAVTCLPVPMTPVEVPTSTTEMEADTRTVAIEARTIAVTVVVGLVIVVVPNYTPNDTTAVQMAAVPPAATIGNWLCGRRSRRSRPVVGCQTAYRTCVCWSGQEAEACRQSGNPYPLTHFSTLSGWERSCVPCCGS
jgi:hypothetical protein